MNKHISKYSEFNTDIKAIYESAIDSLVYRGLSLDFINSNRLNESEEWYETEDEDEEITSGEKAALTRGLSLMTKPQMAAIYLLAKGKCEDVGADYLKMIDGIEAFGYTDEHDGSFNITTPALADAIGMDSDRTLNYTLKKFQNLIDGIGETASQSLSNKLIKAHDALSQADDVKIANFASETMQDASNTKNRDAADSRKEIMSDKASKRREENKKEDEKIGLAVHEIVKSFQAAKIDKKIYSKFVFKEMEKTYPGLTSERIKNAYFKWLKQRGMNASAYLA
tara:strand:+ start:4802 stop:5647 length:846 start_codon:yes stop_codon:yes gene_type:complete